VTDDSKQHYRICNGLRSTSIAIDEALADGAPHLVEATGLWSQPGVFSWDRIDAGSALLAEHLPPMKGNGADLGCGVGYLSRVILSSPAVTKLAMLELDRRAVEQAKKNVDTARTDIRWTDVTVDTSLSNLDFVVMNPPFHDGGIEDRALGHQFIQRAAQALRKGGACWLVANRHLPYEAVMQPLFAQVALRAETGGFKIYEAVK
jgi:16S rRNA (guanine1207-N2)-methyltransferase